MLITQLSIILLSVLAVRLYECIPTVDEIDNGRRRSVKISFKFDCTGKSVGFYADTDYDCKIFHMCDEKMRRIPHICPDYTSFNQEYRICDWDYNFNCSDSPKWYHLNDIQHGVDDLEMGT